MKIKKFIASGVTALLLGAGLAAGPVMTATAHTPSISASCDGLVLKATAYDKNKENKWSTTIDGVTAEGTFGASLDKTFGVAQFGEVTEWSATIQAFNGAYKQTKSGKVGPCGTPPVAPEAKVVYTEWKDEAASCEVDKVTQTRTKTTTPFVWIDGKWVEDTKNVKVETETKTRDKTADEVKPCVEVPKSIVTQSSSEAVDCTTELVIKTTQFFQSDAVWNPATLAYDSFTTPYLVKTATDNRAATVEELDKTKCPVEKQPEAKVVTTSWVDGKYDCDATTVEQTREVSATPFVLVNREWVAGDTTVVIEKQTRNLTAEEIAANECPEPVVPVVEQTPPAKTTAAPALPVTGPSNSLPLMGGASLLLLLGSAAILYARKRSLADLS